MSFKKLALVLALAIPAMQQPVLAQQSSKPGLTQRLTELLSPSKEEELIEPDLAFTANLTVASPNKLVAELKPAPGYYLYRDKIRFAVKDAKDVTIKSVTLPDGKPKKDPTFGTTQVYLQPIRAEILLDRPAGARKVTLTASYQGCHEKTGVCYPPLSKDLTVALP